MRYMKYRGLVSVALLLSYQNALAESPIIAPARIGFDSEVPELTQLARVRCVAIETMPCQINNEATRVLSSPEIATQSLATTATSVPIRVDADDTRLSGAPSADTLFIASVMVDGAANFDASAFMSASAPFIGRAAKPQELTALCKAVADVARKSGYSFASAYIPPQALTKGMLKIVLDEGVISEIRLRGTSNKQLKRILARLVGHAVTRDEADKQITLAGDIPGITIDKVSFVRERERGVLIVTASEQRIGGALFIDNYGSKALGPARATHVVSASGLLRDGDTLTGVIVATPLKPKLLTFAVLKYALPIDSDGTVLSASISAGRTQPGGILADYDVRGRSFGLSAAISHPLVRRRKSSVALGAGIDYLNARQIILSEPFSTDHITTAWLSLNGDAETRYGRLRSELTLTQGLPWFNATPMGDPLASREDADDQFTKAKLTADWTAPIAGASSLKLAAVIQIASGPLLSAQQIGAGGSGFGRAFEYSEISGDDGALGLIELRTDIKHPMRYIDWAQPYVFLDGGRVVILGANGGVGSITQSIMSAGGGLRTRLGKTALNLETAFPVDGVRYETGNQQPRLNFQLTRVF